VVFLQLVEDVQGDQPEGFLRLHEGYCAVGATDVVGQVGAYGRRDELPAVGVGRHRGVEFFDHVVAERAVQVEVEFDFW
jgi:hypothetical protein